MADPRTDALPALLAGVLAALCISAPPALADHAGAPHHVAFYGYDLADGRLLFTGERHAVRQGANVLEQIVYRDPAGDVFQEESAVYDAETLEIVSYSNHHLPTGQSEWVERSGNRLRLTAQPVGGAPRESEEIEFRSEMLVGSSIVRRVQSEPSFLVNGRDLEVSLLLPSALDTIGLRVAKAGERELDGRRVVQVNVTPSSWLLRQLVDPVLIFFGVDAPHDLIESRGRTSARRPDGERFEARVVYRHLAS